MLKLTVLRFYRFTLSLFLLAFFFGGGGPLNYLGLQGGGAVKNF